jgi:hypothetical protein
MSDVASRWLLGTVQPIIGQSRRVDDLTLVTIQVGTTLPPTREVRYGVGRFGFCRVV